MPIIDERGRLFGRYNLIDAGIVLLVLVLLPVGYAAYRLFRPEPITITSITPARVALGGDMRVTLTGRHFVPYLRAQVGNVQVNRVLVATPDEAELVLPGDIPPGTYDLSLYTEAERVALAKNAVTVLPAPEPPPTTVQLVGSIMGLDQAAAGSMKPGRRFPDAPSAGIEIIDAAAPERDERRLHVSATGPASILAPVKGSWRVRATLRASCTFVPEAQRCKVNGIVIVPDIVLPLEGPVAFAIDDVRPDTPGVPLDVVVRFAGRPDVIDLMRAGDVDGLPGGGARAARVIEVRARQAVSSETATQVYGALGAVTETTRIPDRAATVEVLLRLAADGTPDGPMYRHDLVKPGASFTFDTARYVVRGDVVRVTASQQGSASAGSRGR